MQARSDLDHPGKELRALLPAVLQKLQQRACCRSDLLFAAWPKAIGSRFAADAVVQGFKQHTLYIKVKTSTLYALLARYERQRLLQRMQQLCPAAKLQRLVFRFG